MQHEPTGCVRGQTDSDGDLLMGDDRKRLVIQVGLPAWIPRAVKNQQARAVNRGNFNCHFMTAEDSQWQPGELWSASRDGGEQAGGGLVGGTPAAVEDEALIGVLNQFPLVLRWQS